jgi:hypothetical protein
MFLAKTSLVDRPAPKASHDRRHPNADDNPSANLDGKPRLRYLWLHQNTANVGRELMIVLGATCADLSQLHKQTQNRTLSKPPLSRGDDANLALCGVADFHRS